MVIISETPPSSADNGTLWIDANTYFMYVYDSEANGEGAAVGQWVGITNNGGDNTMVHMGMNPPQGNIQEGQMWFDAESGDLRVLYSDVDSSQWVTITSNGQSVGITSNIIRILEEQVADLENKVNDLQDIINDQDGQVVVDLGEIE